MAIYSREYLSNYYILGWFFFSISTNEPNWQTCSWDGLQPPTSVYMAIIAGAPYPNLWRFLLWLPLVIKHGNGTSSITCRAVGHVILAEVNLVINQRTERQSAIYIYQQYIHIFVGDISYKSFFLLVNELWIHIFVGDINYKSTYLLVNQLWILTFVSDIDYKPTYLLVRSPCLQANRLELWHRRSLWIGWATTCCSWPNPLWWLGILSADVGE